MHHAMKFNDGCDRSSLWKLLVIEILKSAGKRVTCRQVLTTWRLPY
jgi:hypothetical protein